MIHFPNFQRVKIACCYGALSLWSTAAAANDFPTLERVRFVQECMALKNSAKYETLYACSCTLDKMAQEMSYDEFVQADSYMRLRNMRGERGSLFRDSDDRARTARKNFQDVKTRAEASCFPTQSMTSTASPGNSPENSNKIQ
jgi:hypothetical protein